MAGVASARCHHVALLSGALEALLFELVEKPQFINPSTAHTVSGAVDFSWYAGRKCARWASHGIVDGRSVGGGRRSSLQSHRAGSIEPCAVECTLCGESDHRVGTDGQGGSISCCWMWDAAHVKLASIFAVICANFPVMRITPVIYVTSHGDFESRAKSILVGANDLIAKPIFQSNSP